MLSIPSASPHFSSTSMKRSLSLLLTKSSGEEEPASKRRCSDTTSARPSYQSDVIKVHANFARALDTTTSSSSSSSQEEEGSSSSLLLSNVVRNHWQTKSSQQRHAFLGKAHVNAERFLRHKGVWEGVATILDRHFTQTLLDQHHEGNQDSITSTTTPEQEAQQQVTVPISCPSSPTIVAPTTGTVAVEAASGHVDDVNAIVENVVSAMCSDDDMIFPDTSTSGTTPAAAPPLMKTTSTTTTMPNVVSTSSLDHHHHEDAAAITETAHALAQAMSLSTSTEEPQQVTATTTTTTTPLEITLVPNPLFSVPNPLLEDTAPPAVVASTTTPATDALLRVQVPSPVVTSSSPQADVTPVSPLSNGSSSSVARHSPVPVWCLDEVAFYDKKHAAAATRNEEWELDPLTLFA